MASDMKEEPLEVEQETLDVEEQWLQRVKEETGLGEGGLDPSFAEVKLEACDSLIQAGSSRLGHGDLEEEMSTLAEPFRYFIKDEPQIGVCCETPSCSEVKVESDDSPSEEGSNKKHATSEVDQPATGRGRMRKSSSDVIEETNNAQKIPHLQRSAFSCTDCRLYFATPLYLERHQKFCKGKYVISSIDGRYPCVTCGQSFLSAAILAVHRRMVHPCPSLEAPCFPCPTCGETFALRDELMKHRRSMHREEFPHHCSQCEMVFEEKSHLCRHEAAHRRKLSALGGVREKGVQNMQAAEKIKDSSNEGHCFNSASKMQVNALIAGVKNEKFSFICEGCGKGFCKKWNLEMHKKIHTGEKPFKCGECGWAFLWKSDLQTHERVHNGERPFKCAECAKAFKRSCDLNVHMKSHNAEKPFKCPHCERAFTHSGQLTRHLRLHTGERPYPCTECGKRFSDSSHLSRHRQSVHRDSKSVKVNSHFTSN